MDAGVKRCNDCGLEYRRSVNERNIEYHNDHREELKEYWLR